jgi:mono/diheme cytochrome c family protein
MRMTPALFALAAATALAVPASAATTADNSTVARGRYLVMTSGCNDCHTPGYAETGGRVREADWLTGNPVGFRGPWGVSYPANLRLTAQSMPEAAWIARARSQLLPPMPWFALRDMKNADVRAIYRYIRSLGAKGVPAPAYVRPGAKVATPYIEFVPKNLPRKTAVR